MRMNSLYRVYRLDLQGFELSENALAMFQSLFEEPLGFSLFSKANLMYRDIIKPASNRYMIPKELVERLAHPCYRFTLSDAKAELTISETFIELKISDSDIDVKPILFTIDVFLKSQYAAPHQIRFLLDSEEYAPDLSVFLETYRSDFLQIEHPMFAWGEPHFGSRTMKWEYTLNNRPFETNVYLVHHLDQPDHQYRLLLQFELIKGLCNQEWLHLFDDLQTDFEHVKKRLLK